MRTLTLLQQNVDKSYVNKQDNYAEISLLPRDFTDFRLVSKSGMLWFEDDTKSELLWLNMNGPMTIRIANNEMRIKFIYKDRIVYYGIYFNKDNFIRFLYKELINVQIVTRTKLVDLITNIRYIEEFFINLINSDNK